MNQKLATAKTRIAKRIQRRREESLRWVMSDPRGRRTMWTLLSDAGIFRTSFTGNDAETNFREGHRNMGLQLWEELHRVCPERTLEMQAEAAKEAANDAQELEAAAAESGEAEDIT